MQSYLAHIGGAQEFKKKKINYVRILVPFKHNSLF